MTDYTQATDFSVKDALPSGNPEKIILGLDIDDELGLIATAITSKANKLVPAAANNIALLSSSGDLVDGGILSSGLKTRNLIMNGDLNVWQDGTSEGGITGTSRRMADGWLFSVSAQGTWTVDRVTAVPTVAQAGRQLNFSQRASVTTADTTTSAGDFVVLEYTVEGHDYNELFSQPQTLSFWANCSITGTFHVALRNDANDRSFIFTFTIDTANVWELKTFVLTAVPTGTFAHQTGAGLKIAITLAAGTTFHTTANAWQTGNFLATSAQTNLAGTVNNTMHIADMRLHGGVTRRAVIIPTFNEVLLWAGRRFIKSFPYATKPAQNAGIAGSINVTSVGTAAGTRAFSIRFPVAMRLSPTTTSFNPSAADANWTDGSAVTFSRVDTSGMVVTNTDVISDGTGASLHYTADSRY